MKTFCVLLLSAFLMASCSSNDTSAIEVQASHATHNESTPTDGLALNAGERWQADEPTNQNMRQLHDLMLQHQQLEETNSLAALNELGNGLQLGFKEVFADCRMKGPEHDMLHTYLMPMMADVKVLEGQDIEAAAQSRGRLTLRLSQYQTYFK